jgi:lipoate-protein ligase A
VLQFEDDETRANAVQFLRDRAATVEDLLGSSITWQQMADAVAEGFREALDLTLEHEAPSESEITQAEILVNDRYQDRDWTARL